MVDTADGRKAFGIDAVGQRTDFGYDTLGRLVAVTQPAVADPVSGQTKRPVTAYGYDAYGHQTSITDANGHATQLRFDRYGRPTGRTLPGGATEATAYDAFGATDYHVDFNGAKVDTVYDYETGSGLATKLGRVARTDLYDAANVKVESIAYTYDGFGRTDVVTETKGAATRVTDTDYDIEGRVVKVVRPEGTINYGYEDATGRHTKTWTDKTEVGYAYDTLGRLSDVTDVTGGLKTSYAFDAVGNATNVVTKQGAVTLKSTANAYDPARHWLVSVANTDGGGNPLSLFTYTRRPDGRLLTESESVKQPDNSVVSSTAAYTYDALNRLTKESFDGPAGTDYTKSYTLDLVGNRTQLVVSKEGLPADTTNSVYNARDQLMTETTGATIITSGYDADGSLTSQSGGTSSRTQSWDVRGRLSGATVDGVATSYLYTLDGIRSSVTEAGMTVAYVIDGMSPSGYAQVVEERASGLLVASYVYGAGLDPIGMTRGGVASLYLADGHSGVRQAISAAGLVQLAQRFDAFGGTVAKAGTLVSPIGYRGERFDATLGQYYLRARFYDPLQGRFTGMDPYAGTYRSVNQVNRYGYAGMDPIGILDPSGREGLGGLMVSISISIGFATLLLVGVSGCSQKAATLNTEQKLTAQSRVFVDRVKAGSVRGGFVFDPSAGAVPAPGVGPGTGPCFHHSALMVKWIKAEKAAGNLPAGTKAIVRYFDVTPPDLGARQHVITEVQFLDAKGNPQIRLYDGGTPAIPYSNIGDDNGLIDKAKFDALKTSGKLTERPGSPFTP